MNSSIAVRYFSKKKALIIFALAVLAIVIFNISFLFPYGTSDYDLSNVNSNKDPNESESESFLSLEDFTESELISHSSSNADRFASKDVWRPSDVYESKTLPKQYLDFVKLRPKLPDLSQFSNKGQYFKQPIVADYVKNAESVFLMLKEGSNLLWKRVPIHFMTTFTRVPYFAIYADAPASIAGIEVIDILANVSSTTKTYRDFDLYHKLERLRQSNAVIDPAELDFGGGWDLDKYKNVPMLFHAYKTAPASVNWFIFMDGDTYFFMDNLMDYLNTLNPEVPLYIGSAASYGDVNFAHGGTGVVLSRKALEVSLGQHPEWVKEVEPETMVSCCGDYIVAYMLGKANITVAFGHDYPYVEQKFQGQPYWNIKAERHTWCQKVVSFHHLSSLEVEILWEYERLLGPKARTHITYGDIYRDFVSPHIDTIMPNWNNMADEMVFQKPPPAPQTEETNKNQQGKRDGPKGDEIETEDQPWTSAEACQQACSNWPSCLSWRYVPGETYCAIDKAVKLGRPVINDIPFPYVEDNKNFNFTGTVSGYFLPRIRKMRKSLKCDAIRSDKNQKNDEEYLRLISEGKLEDRYEGWFLRSQKNNL